MKLPSERTLCTLLILCTPMSCQKLYVGKNLDFCLKSHCLEITLFEITFLFKKEN